MIRRWIPFVLVCLPAAAQQSAADFFESKIRPVLAGKCFTCHASTLASPIAGLTLDTKAGLARVVTAGKPEQSRLLQAIRYTDPDLQMPPTGKLPDSVIADFEQWIVAGALDPRTATANQSPAPLKGMSIEDGRKWWSFQPVLESPAPRIKDAAWAKTKIDAFILAKLEDKGMTPSPPADKRTLVERVYVDLIGMKPTYEEVEAFVNDTSPDAYEKLVDKLLASQHYGERWGRHWLDVARYAEDNPTSEATNPGYPYAWRYRDWVIDAFNKDVPYDRFVKLQLAADLMKDASRDDMRALGYLGAAPIYHKDRRLSEEVLSGFMTDDWDERVDAVSRGLLGMTVACARCHDHKFDPILTKDYYALVGVFASTMRVERPMFDVDPQTETRYLWAQNQLFDLRYSANLLTNEATTVVDSAPRVAKWKADIDSLKTEIEAWRDRYPQLVESLEKYWNPPQPGRGGGRGAAPPAPAPFMNAVYDAAQFTDGSDKQFTWIVIKPGEARDFPVLQHGSVTSPGEIVPRHFPTVLVPTNAKGDANFKTGSGRLELAERMFSDSAPLAARVIVNRVWAWHFGRPLVGTPSDFGTQGERPTHPELLDDLAARFIAHGWSMKWLNREIMLSAAYRQSSRSRPEGEQVDQANALVWRMNPRRLDVESYRDSILRAAGTLDEQMYGPSEDVDRATSVRRTVYGRVSRNRLSNLLKLYDFPDPAQTSPGRELTTTSLQQLFVMNSAFIQGQAAALVNAVQNEPDATAKVRALYRRILSRDPSQKDLDLAADYLAASYLKGGGLNEYAQALLATNEEIFWP
jgi:Protein of unknown function (DUF1549)/Protein of unknown function (DUF1553)/Planctomycete cytochrome C